MVSECSLAGIFSIIILVLPKKFKRAQSVKLFPKIILDDLTFRFLEILPHLRHTTLSRCYILLKAYSICINMILGLNPTEQQHVSLSRET